MARGVTGVHSKQFGVRYLLGRPDRRFGVVIGRAAALSVSLGLALPLSAAAATIHTTGGHEAAEAGRWGLCIALAALVGPSALAWFISVTRAKRRGAGNLATGFRRLLVGEDNRVSTSKVIAATWTYFLAAGLLSVIITKWLGHSEAFDATLNAGLEGQYGVLIGGPLGAAILAKSIVVSQLAKDPGAKPSSPASPAVSQLIANDAGDTDLGDLQYVLFNAVALVFFLGTFLQTPDVGMPRIPDLILGLTSVSAVGYVGKKVVPAAPSGVATGPSGGTTRLLPPAAAVSAAPTTPAHATIDLAPLRPAVPALPPIRPIGGNGGGGHPTVVPTADYSLVQEAGGPAVYVMIGGAKLHIPDPEEFNACGYRWSDVTQVPPGALSSLPTIPRDSTLVRQRDQPEVWVMSSGRKVWIPSADAMTCMQLDWNLVRVAPAGTLDAFPSIRLLSNSHTPASMVFAPPLAGVPGTNNVWDPPTNVKWYPRQEVPGVTLPNGSHLVELRGWVYSIDGQGGDPDWHMSVDLDPAYLDSIGIDWPTFFKVGDILNNGATDEGIQPVPTSHISFASRPMLKIELDGWPNPNGGGNFPDAEHKPTDWGFDTAPPIGTQSRGVAATTVTWPYALDHDYGDPPASSPGSPLQKGDYVRISGSLVTDIPHVVGPGDQDFQNAASDWIGGLSVTAGERAVGCPARWTEMHPPDAVVLMNPSGGPPRTEYVYGVAVVARSATLNPSSTDESATFALAPPGDRPPHSMAIAHEYVGPETNFRTIIEGNAELSGAAIVPGPKSVLVHVKVRGQPFNGVPGKFKAVYRVSRAPDPSGYRLIPAMIPQPASVTMRVATACAVTATDNETGEAVSATVLLNGVVVGTTGTPFTATFTPATTRVYIPGNPEAIPRQPGHWIEEQVGPDLVIHAGSPYPDATITVGAVRD